MSESRLCGYCRQPGHRKPVCPTMHEQRNLVLTHTPKERKRLLQYLGRLGLGNGALVGFDANYWDTPRVNNIGIIHDFGWVSDCNFMDVRNIKYSKQVVLTPRDLRKDYEYRSIHVQYMETGSGITENRNLGIRISRNIQMLENTCDPKQWAWDKQYWSVLSPSHEVDYDPGILVRNIHMPRRLLLAGENEYNVRGIMPPDNE